MEIYDKLQSIVNEILDEPRREYAGSGEWFEYNCPRCKDENFGEADDKYNLAVNFKEGYCHCWKCFYSSKLSRMVKEYGSVDQFNSYKDEVTRIKEVYYYQIQSGEFIIYDDPIELEPLNLPDCHDVHDGTYDGNKALQYLYNRGVGDDIIDRHNIKYVGDVWGEKYRNMIIIPSYDEFGELNYFTGRDFTGRKDFNKKNPDIPKTEVVFDSGMINYYEPIQIVEGPFDHIVVPNSVPLLGKSLAPEDAVFRLITHKAKHNINIMLDSDARQTAVQLYKLLNNGKLVNRVNVIDCPKDMDPSDVYKHYGKRGIIALIGNAHHITGLELAKAAPLRQWSKQPDSAKKQETSSETRFYRL